MWYAKDHLYVLRIKCYYYFMVAKIEQPISTGLKVLICMKNMKRSICIYWAIRLSIREVTTFSKPILLTAGIACPSLSAPADGQRAPASGGSLVNTVVRLSCNAGYRLVGSAVRICQSDGQWSGPPTTCQRMYQQHHHHHHHHHTPPHTTTTATTTINNNNNFIFHYFPLFASFIHNN